METDSLISEIESNILNGLKGKGLIACSGGLDSTLLAVIASKVAGGRVLSVFVDTGLLRLGERERVESIFKSHGLDYKIVDASKRFFKALRGVSDPEKKRKIIGELFIRIFEDEAQLFGTDTLLQGTIAPDWIESGGGARDTIKSHHNVGGLPSDMKLKLLEPLKDLYKDEIRAISGEIGIDSYRQPFPGPGLAVRVLGEVTEEDVELLREAGNIVEQSVEKFYSNKEELPWQYFAVLLPVYSTGIHGDLRTFGRTIVVRIFDSIDAMSGTFRQVPWVLLDEISTEITNKVKSVNRVVYDVTNKPPGTIEWE